MSAPVLDINITRDLDTLLGRLPDGVAGKRLAMSLGMWTESVHLHPNPPGYPKGFSDLADPEISDLSATWVAQVGRAGELVGLLEGQRGLASMEARRARASARSRARRALAEEGKKGKTAAELNDDAESDFAVMAADELVALIDVALASSKAYKEAALAVAASVSREISMRQAQYGARIRIG